MGGSWGEMRTVCWVGEELEFHFSNHFSSHCCHM